MGYFLMAIPSGMLARRFGYKGGIIIGLALIAVGAFWFIPATQIGTFGAFLVGLFILATGLTCLETVANPYATALGPPDTGAARINLAQAVTASAGCSGLWWAATSCCPPPPRSIAAMRHCICPILESDWW